WRPATPCTHSTSTLKAPLVADCKLRALLRAQRCLSASLRLPERALRQGAARRHWLAAGTTRSTASQSLREGVRLLPPPEPVQRASGLPMLPPRGSGRASVRQRPP